MSIVSRKSWIYGIGGSLLLGGISFAGATGGNPTPAQTTALGDIPDHKKLTVEESLSKARDMSARMGEAEGRMISLQKRAEAKKDMVMVNCIVDKIGQARGYIAVGAAAGRAVQVAADRHDDTERSHQLDRQSIIFQKVLVISIEAEGCSGEDVSYIGQTRVDTEIDPNIPPDDPTAPVTPPVTAERPPEGSCPNS